MTLSRAGGSRDDRGSTSLVTLVLMVPALFLCILTVVQFGLWYHASHVAQAAAQEGARAARLMDGSGGAGESRAREMIRQLGSSLIVDPEVNAHRDPGGNARVEVSGYAASILSFLDGRLRVRAVSEGPVERFRGEDEEFGR